MSVYEQCQSYVNGTVELIVILFERYPGQSRFQNIRRTNDLSTYDKWHNYHRELIRQFLLVPRNKHPYIQQIDEILESLQSVLGEIEYSKITSSNTVPKNLVDLGDYASMITVIDDVSDTFKNLETIDVGNIEEIYSGFKRTTIHDFNEIPPLVSEKYRNGALDAYITSLRLMSIKAYHSADSMKSNLYPEAATKIKQQTELLIKELIQIRGPIKTDCPWPALYMLTRIIESMVVLRNLPGSA